jgi:hypothetical protein
LFFLKATLFWVSWVIVSLLGILWFLFQFLQKRNQRYAPVFSSEDLSQATIFDATIDDIVILSGFGEGFDDVHLTVTEHNSYRLENGFTWDEVICQYQGKELCIEAEKNHNEVFISATSESRRLELQEIQDAEGNLLNDEKMKYYLQADDDEEYIVFRNKRYYFDEGRKCLFLPKQQEEESELFFYWDFEDEKEEEILSIERWEDSPTLVVYRGTILHPDFVSLLKAR